MKNWRIKKKKKSNEKKSKRKRRKLENEKIKNRSNEMKCKRKRENPGPRKILFLIHQLRDSNFVSLTAIHSFDLQRIFWQAWAPSVGYFLAFLGTVRTEVDQHSNSISDLWRYVILRNSARLLELMATVSPVNGKISYLTFDNLSRWTIIQIHLF